MIVYTDAWELPTGPGPESLVTVLFANLGGKTRIAIITEFPTAADVEAPGYGDRRGLDPIARAPRTLGKASDWQCYPSPELQKLTLPLKAW